MPWSPKQHRLFELLAHGGTPHNGANISQTDAARMASEGVKEHPAVKAHKFLKKHGKRG